VSVPLADSPIASVNLYALEHEHGVLLVDAGYDDYRCWSVLEAALAPLGGVMSVTGIVLTHNHPDHVGLAARVRETSGAWIAIHPLDALSEPESTHGSFLSQLATELELAGVPADLAAEMIEASRRLAKHSGGLRADRFIVDGDRVEEGGLVLDVIGTPGHTRGHVCLFERMRNALFGGDLLLDGGELQLGLVATDEDDPVQQLEASLALVATLPVELVLPGHWGRFTDARPRAAASIEELRVRVAQADELVRASPGCTAWELAAGAEWGRPWAAMGITGRRFAVMQSIAWARRLVSLGRCTLEAGPPERYSPVE
jgi:glyoxylase-like metal-dependent hydrolase (beta-lactamase superfamily II)